MLRGTVSIPTAAALFLTTAPAHGQRALPDGIGKTLVESACTRCHGVSQIIGSVGYTQEEWRDIFGSMVALPEAQAVTVAGYLGSHFPRKEGQSPVLLDGSASVEMREWMLPTLGQRPHDPEFDEADGSIWWTGQWADRLGRLDSTTGEMEEFLLPSGARPHGLASDADGNIWYTGNGDAHVGKLDTRTGIVTVYPTTARDPHTPVFARDGTLWFTAQNANVIGRLVPSTGELREVAVPTANAKPYGIRMSSAGVPWLVLFGTNKLASVDPRTMAVQEYPLPDPAARPRRLALSGDDVVWYTDYARGFLGRFDPGTGDVREWPSPSGRTSRPYGIDVADGAIWYSESGTWPNTLVRFDPATEAFQSWPIESGGGVVRNMVATPDGDLVMALSGVNRIAVVKIGRPASNR